MTRSKLGLKALGLCIVLGTMAFVASAAQAETGAYWSLKNKAGTLLKIGTSGLLPSLAWALEEGGLSLLATIAGVPTKITCKKGTLFGMKLEGNGSLTNGGKAQFTECETFLKGVKSSACNPRSPGNGEILTNALKGLLRLHELKGTGLLDDIVRLEPSTGSEYASLILGENEECSIGETIPLAGQFAIWEAGNGVLNYVASHLIQQFTSLTNLVALGNSATIDGSANITLAGEDVTLAWSGTPG